MLSCVRNDLGGGRRLACGYGTLLAWAVMNGEHESPRSEMEIGRSLREAREERGLTLGQVEERTKVRARYLQDLEQENFGVLPVVYVLGSLKTYADHLGLDGEALSADLKRRLGPQEPENLTEEPAEAGDDRDAEDEYEAVPLLTAGFDHLFLGMGLVLIFGLAVTTFVFALATNDGPAVSQIREPALPETPSEIALAGNFLERPEREPRSPVAPPEPESSQDDGRNTEEKDEDPPEQQPDPPEQQPEDASSQDSFSDEVGFAPVPPSSPAPIGTASASASPAPAASTTSSTTSSAPASPAPTSPAPATDAPTSTASAGAPSAATVPAAAPPESARTGATPASAAAEPEPAAIQRAPAGMPNGSGPRGTQPGGMDASSLVDRIDARVNAAVDSVR